MGGVRWVMGRVRGVMVRYRSTCLEGIRMVMGCTAVPCKTRGGSNSERGGLLRHQVEGG